MAIEVRKPTEAEIETARTWPIWSKEESTFDWHYDQQETCLILEGRVTVKTDEETISFKAGDLVIFPQGLDCVWKIEEAVRKHYKFG